LATSRRSRASTSQMTSTFLLEAPPANPSRLQASEADWLTNVATSRLSILGLLTGFAPAGWYGRTCPAFYQAPLTSRPIHVRRRHQWTWDATEQRWKLKTSTAQKSYTPSTASWPDFQNSGMGTHTEFLTLSTLEFHSAAVASSLSDILETGDLPQRYFLSATACKGILRRAAKRGKELPRQLAAALQVAAGSELTSI